ncbi:hypothetical protein ACFY41_31980 [Streptomyces syringium]|uniref:hypothetical protein n=1 Tax=Streptomyces syringium TaxID=76729 RepID=UPI0036A95DDB
MLKAAQFTGAALMAAVLMTGCGSGSDDGKKKDKETGATAPASDKPGAGGESAQPGAGDPAKMDGMWNRQKGTEIIRVTIMNTTAISASAGAVCNGPATKSGTTAKLDLKCNASDNTRAKGTATLSADGKKLTVSWDNGPTEDFTKDPIKVEMPKIEMPKIDTPTIPAG